MEGRAGHRAHDAAGNSAAKEVFVNIVAVPPAAPPTPLPPPPPAAVVEKAPEAPPPPPPAFNWLPLMVAVGLGLLGMAGAGAFWALRRPPAPQPEAAVACERCGAPRAPGLPYCPACAAQALRPREARPAEEHAPSPPEPAPDQYGTRLMEAEDRYATSMMGAEAPPADEAATRLMEAPPPTGEEWLSGATLVSPRPILSGARLTVRGRAGEQAFPLTKPQTILGRAPESDVCILDPRASRHHARIWREGYDYWLEDLGSTNGTLVNNQLVQRCPLRDGDLILIGDTPVLFQRTA